MRFVRLAAIIMAGLLPIVLLSAACGKRGAGARTFELHGQVLAVRDTQAVIKHDEIKGFMPAMTMPYRVRDRELLRGTTAGDLITATLVVSDNDAWLTRIEKTGSAPITTPVPEPSATAGVSLLQSGDPVPDTQLTNEQGEPIALTSWRGSAVAITFIYTRCPLPQFCPLLDRRFAAVQRIVAADPALHGRVHLLSVSFDPDADTPAVLRAHAAKLGADPAVWRFATAPRDVVDRFAARFAVNVIREADRTITHNLRTAVIAPSGRVFAIYDGTEWTPQQIAEDLGRSLAAR